MRIKNKDLKRINRALFTLGNHQGSIKTKWEIAKISKPFNMAVELLDITIQKIIQEKGVDKYGQKTLSITHPDYVALMELDIDVDCKMLTLEYLERFNPTMQELIDLDVIIDE